MESLFLLVPLALLIIGLIAAALIWAVMGGQFEALEQEGRRVLLDGEGCSDAPADQPKNATISSASRSGSSSGM
jgi:cbb3-type cytochrome oxidase maturation protein